MHRLTALALALTLAAPVTACGHPPSVVVQAAPADRTTALTAAGSATVAVAPDCADLTLTVSSNAARPSDAIAAVRKAEAGLVDALKQRGIADADLSLSFLGVDPAYRYEGTRNVLDGYHAHVTITATTRKFDQLGDLMETAAAAGVTEIASRFRRSDLETLRKHVREQALVAARTKANDTAAVLGVTLGRVISVSDTAEGYLASNEYFPSSSSSAGGGLGGELQPLTINVTVVYEL